MIKIPFVLVEGLPTFHAYVDGREIRVLLDTGAVYSIINSPLKKGKRVGSIELVGFTGSTKKVGMHPMGITIQDNHLEDVFLAIRMEIPYDAVVGSNFLKRYEAIIDYSCLELRIKV